MFGKKLCKKNLLCYVLPVGRASIECVKVNWPVGREAQECVDWSFGKEAKDWVFWPVGREVQECVDQTLPPQLTSVFFPFKLINICDI